MKYETFGKEYFISVKGDRVIISKNPNPHLVTFEDMEDVNKRYIYKEGDKITTPFGIQTIKEIIRNYGEQRGYEWLILVEENGNQYKPMELIGIFVKEMTLDEFEMLIG